MASRKHEIVFNVDIEEADVWDALRNHFPKSVNFDVKESDKQKRTADKCWAVREKYLSSSWKFCPYCGESISTHH